jgi:hypothetical protein
LKQRSKIAYLCLNNIEANSHPPFLAVYSKARRVTGEHQAGVVGRQNRMR